MSDLPDFVVDRHGATDRWHQASAVSAASVDGSIWAFKGQPGRLGCESVPADLDHGQDPIETRHAEHGRQHA